MSNSASHPAAAQKSLKPTQSSYGHTPDVPSGAKNSTAEPTPQEVEAVLALFRQRRYPEAEILAQELTVRFPFHGFGWKALGAVLKQQGRGSESLAPLARAVDLMPENAEAHYNLGNCLLEQDGLQEAEACYRRALAFNCDYLGAHYNLGNVLQRQARFAEAEASYRLALKLKPDFAEACGNLGIVQREQGRLEEAETSFRRLLEITPQDPQALQHNPKLAITYFYLGSVLQQLGKMAEAETAYQQALRCDPNLADAYSHLGVLLRGQGRIAEAENHCRRALELIPDYADAHNNLGNVLREQERYDEAEASYLRALELRPNFAEAYYNLGNVHKEQSRYGDAEADYRRALEIRPDYAEAHNKLGNSLKEQGRMEEAAIAFEAAIAIKPDFVKAHYSLSAIKTYREGDPHLAMLDQQIAQVDEMSDEARIRFWFAVGKAKDDTGRFDESFAAYQEGNRLKRASVTWDDAFEDAALERMLTVFSREFFAACPKPQAVGRAPIFIVGMPRSGTTLLEQILATHPGVHGAGELPDMSEVIMAAMPNADPAQFPNAVPGLSLQDLLRVGEQYTDRIWQLAPDAVRITDKMPSNFFYLGMIHLMLPHAKIIHAMRDPMDSCFSCFSRLFNENNLGFTYDLETLGRYYVRYSKLMRHWHAVLPPGTILDLRYEDMVADTEGQARRLLDYLDLPWDEKCLDFHQNKRQVKTASAAQVRKPIYKTSLARWKRFGGHLDPLFELVKDFRE